MNINPTRTGTPNAEPTESNVEPKLAGVFTLFKSAFGLLRQYFWKYLGATFLLSIVWFIALLVLGPLLFIFLSDFFRIILPVTLWLVGGLYPLSLISIFTEITKNDTGVFASLAATLKRSFSLFAFFILSSFIFIVSFLPIVTGALFTTFEISVVPAFIPYLIGFIVSIPFVFSCTIYFSQALFILTAERTSAMEALKKSYSYVRGRWWGVFFRFFLYILIIFLVLFAIMLGFFLFLFPLLFVFPFIIILSFYLIGAVLSCLLFFLSYTYNCSLYANLLIGRETQETLKTPGLLWTALILGSIVLFGIIIVLSFQGSLIADGGWQERQTESALPFFDQTELIIDD